MRRHRHCDIVWERPYDTAAAQVIERLAWRRPSPSRELIRDFGENRQDENARLLLTQFDRSPPLVRLLNQASPGEVHVFLEDGRRRQSLTSWVQVFDGERWELFNPNSGQQGRPDNLLLWEAAGQAVLEVEGGSNSRVSFSMLSHSQPATSLRNQHADDTLLNFSIHSLPLEEQALFQPSC